MKIYKKLTPFAQYYTKFDQRCPNASEDAQWTLNHLSLFENLIPGEVYIYFNTETPVLESEVPKVIKSAYIVNGRLKRGQTEKRISPDKNPLVMRPSICEKCGCFRASQKMKNPDCNSCIIIAKNLRIKNRKRMGEGAPKKVKKIKKVKVVASKIAFNITGDYERVSTQAYVPDVLDEVESLMCG